MQPGFGHGSAGRRDIHDHLTQVAPARTRLHDGDAIDPLGRVEAGFVQQAVGVAADDQINGAVRECPCQLHVPRARGGRRRVRQAVSQMAEHDQHVTERPQRRQQVAHRNQWVGDGELAPQHVFDLGRGGEADHPHADTLDHKQSGRIDAWRVCARGRDQIR